MGLERVAAVLQGVISNYDTDLFTPLIARAAESDTEQPPPCRGRISRRIQASEVWLVEIWASLRVIADHARAATFLISDGVVPANEGRGYVLRKILRRAITHGRELGQSEARLRTCRWSLRCVEQMQDAYPELGETDRAGLIA